MVRPWPAQRRSTSAMNRSVSASDLPAAPPGRRRVGGQHRVDAALQRGQRQHRRRAAVEARAAGRRAIVGVERERRRVAEPSGEGLAPALGVHAARVARMGPEERGRTGPAVQVLVAAAHGEVGGALRRSVAMKLHGHGAGRVRQIPDHERAGGVGGAVSPPACRACGRCGSRRGSAARRPFAGDRGGHVVRVDEPQREPVLPRERVRHVEIGGKVRAVGEHDAPRRRVRGGDLRRRRQHLVQVHRRRVRDDELAGGRRRPAARSCRRSAATA